MDLNPQQQLLEISQLVEQHPVCVAYSGGVDSHVLLHLLAQSRNTFSRLRAVHINHSLQSDAESWAEHCRAIATQLDIELTIITVKVEQTRQLGLEAAARKARYQAIKTNLAANEILLTAQHRQDQAETLLLQLLRGAGPAGLAAMKQDSRLFGMRVIRPFLDISKQELLDYARSHQLNWIDDPSNSNTQINRNYLRHEIWPLLQQRWPGADKTLSRSAQHCHDAVALIEEVAQQDAVICLNEQGNVSVTDLLVLSAARQRNVLRYILEQKSLPLPSTVCLQRIIDEVCLAADDAQPVVSWPGAVVRRYQDALYFDSEDQTRAISQQGMHLNDFSEVTLGDGRILKWQQTMGEGLKPAVVEAGLQLRYRQGGETIYRQGHAHHTSLKHLFQQWQIPPWQRSSIPLLFLGEELVAVVGYAYAQGYAAEEREMGWFPRVDGADS